MIIEWLKVKIAAAQREQFIQLDDEIWTAALAQNPGFLGKDIWIDPTKSDELVLVIRWANREAWKSIPAASLEQTERKFAQRMGTIAYQLIETGEYQVRRFARLNS